MATKRERTIVGAAADKKHRGGQKIVVTQRTQPQN